MARIGRNNPCPCGSGRKYKRCCGALRAGQTVSDRDDAAVTASARGQDAGADARRGLRFLTAGTAPSDAARGVALIEKAALAGDAGGAYLAATLAASSFWRRQEWDAAFDYLLRAALAGHEPAQSSLRILAGGPSGKAFGGDDWEKMRAGIDRSAWLAPPAVRMIREAPRIYVIEKFAPAAACDWLIAQAKGRLTRATIYDKATGGTAEDYRRTNTQCDLDIETCGVLTFVLRGRIAAITGRQDQAMEIPKVLHYAPGETFAEHFDYLDPAEPAYAAQLAERGQRTDTLLLYQNEGFSGGETYFPEIKLSYKGGKGDALLFANINAAGAPDPDTMHVGMPPTSGEKWLFSQWIREFPR